MRQTDKNIYITAYTTIKYILAAVGFEPTPPKRLVPKTSALDHSATLPYIYIYFTSILIIIRYNDNKSCSIYCFRYIRVAENHDCPNATT